MFLSAFLGSYHVLIASTNEHFHGAACAEGEDALAAQCSEAVSRHWYNRSALYLSPTARRPAHCAARTSTQPAASLSSQVKSPRL